MNFSRNALGCAMLVAAIAVGSASAVCTNADLIGVWGFELTSRSGLPGAIVGQVTFDGNGNFIGSETESDNGTIQTNTVVGTYSLAKDCTGTLASGDTFNIVLHNGKKSLEIIDTTNGALEWGFALAQGTVTCGLSGKKETWASNLFGPTGAGRTAAVGQIILNGNGGITGNTITWSVEGTINSAAITGTYTENADCTGTATVTPSGFPTSHYNLVVVNAGKEALLIQTDPNTVVAGTMQK